MSDSARLFHRTFQFSGEFSRSDFVRCRACSRDVPPSAISGVLHGRRGLTCEGCALALDALRTVSADLRVDDGPMVNHRRRVLDALSAWARRREWRCL